MEPVLISVIVPTYNNGAAISTPVNCINSQLQPENKSVEFEIIIVDDASDEDKYNEVKKVVLREKNVNLIRCDKNGGPAVARNVGLKAAKGEFITFLDADDLWPENKIRLQLPAFEDPSLVIVGGKVKYQLTEGVHIDLDQWEDEQQRITHVHLGALLLRREVIDKGYLFDEELRYSEDVDWWLRVREDNLGISILEETTLLYQVHGKNMTMNKNIHELNLLKVLHKSLIRRKAKGLDQNIPQIRDFRKKREDLLISVIVPLYNGKDTIDRALESIRRQSCPRLEIVVVDDGSADGGAEYVAAKYPEVTLLRQKNKGVAAARNAGINAAKGDLIAFLDQDDEWLSEKIAKQYALLKEDAYCGWVTCNQQFYYEEGMKPPVFFKPEIAQPHRSFVPSGLLIRKHVINSLYGFDESITMGNDMDLIRRLQNAGVKGMNVEEVLLKKWFGEKNESYDANLAKSDIFSMLRKQIKHNEKD